jgi:hypothetical protein
MNPKYHTKTIMIEFESQSTSVQKMNAGRYIYTYLNALNVSILLFFCKHHSQLALYNEFPLKNNMHKSVMMFFHCTYVQVFHSVKHVFVNITCEVVLFLHYCIRVTHV